MRGHYSLEKVAKRLRSTQEIENGFPSGHRRTTHLAAVDWDNWLEFLQDWELQQLLVENVNPKVKSFTPVIHRVPSVSLFNSEHTFFFYLVFLYIYIYICIFNTLVSFMNITLYTIIKSFNDYIQLYLIIWGCLTILHIGQLRIFYFQLY